MQIKNFEFRSANQNSKIQCRKAKSLRFGKSLGRVCSDDKLPEKLNSLLLYLYVNASQVHTLVPLCPVQEGEYKELKSRLKSKRRFPMCQYSESAALAALRNYLKHLPYPVLDTEKWKNICYRFFSEDSLTEPKIKAMAQEILSLESLNMTPTEKNFFRHLVLVIREASKDKRRKRIQFERLISILDFLGPSLMRSKGKALSRPKSKKILDGIDKVFLTFVVCFADEIYGRELDNLYPPHSAFKIRHTFERSFRLFNPYQ